METTNCNHARSDIEEPRQLPGARASDKSTLRHRQADQKAQVWLLENFRFLYMVKMLEQTVENELVDSLVSMKLQQKEMVVADGLTPFVTFVTSYR